MQPLFDIDKDTGLALGELPQRSHWIHRQYKSFARINGRLMEQHVPSGYNELVTLFSENDDIEEVVFESLDGRTASVHRKHLGFEWPIIRKKRKKKRKKNSSYEFWNQFK